MLSCRHFNGRMVIIAIVPGIGTLDIKKAYASLLSY